MRRTKCDKAFNRRSTSLSSVRYSQGLTILKRGVESQSLGDESEYSSTTVSVDEEKKYSRLRCLSTTAFGALRHAVFAIFAELLGELCGQRFCPSRWLRRSKSLTAKFAKEFRKDREGNPEPKAGPTAFLTPISLFKYHLYNPAKAGDRLPFPVTVAGFGLFRISAASRLAWTESHANFGL